MTGYAQSSVDAIDARIAKSPAGETIRHPATMVSRATSGSGGTAIFDGSTTAVPVKVPGSVHAFAGDRVGIAKFGKSDWVVVYAFPRWGDSEAGVNTVAASDSTSSASYSAISGVPTFTWRKRYDDSRAVLRLTVGMFAAAPPSQAEYAVQLDDGVNPATDYFLVRLRTDAGGHVSATAEDIIDGIPAALYTVTARWRKTTGGAAQLNNVDTVSVGCRETGQLHP